MPALLLAVVVWLVVCLVYLAGLTLIARKRKKEWQAHRLRVIERLDDLQHAEERATFAA